MPAPPTPHPVVPTLPVWSSTPAGGCGGPQASPRQGVQMHDFVLEHCSYGDYQPGALRTPRNRVWKCTKCGQRRSIFDYVCWDQAFHDSSVWESFGAGRCEAD